MQIRRAILSDANIIQRLAESIWWKHYPSIIGEEQVRFMLNKMYNLENIEKQISKEEQQYFILENDGQDLGFFSIEVREASIQFIVHAWCRLACGVLRFSTAIFFGGDSSLSPEERKLIAQLLELLRSGALASLMPTVSPVSQVDAISPNVQ